MFENLVNQECRKTARLMSWHGNPFENLVNQEYRTLNKYAIKFMVKLHNPQKLKYGESSQTPQREFTSESDHHVNESILSRKNLKVNTTTMTPTNQGVIF